MYYGSFRRFVFLVSHLHWYTDRPSRTITRLNTEKLDDKAESRQSKLELPLTTSRQEKDRDWDSMPPTRTGSTLYKKKLKRQPAKNTRERGQLSRNIAKKALRKMQTLRTGCSKAEPKIFAPTQNPFPGARDGQNIISWRWSLSLPTNPVW